MGNDGTGKVEAGSVETGNGEARSSEASRAERKEGRESEICWPTAPHLEDSADRNPISKEPELWSAVENRVLNPGVLSLYPPPPPPISRQAQIEATSEVKFRSNKRVMAKFSVKAIPPLVTHP